MSQGQNNAIGSAVHTPIHPEKKADLDRICRSYDVARLEIFGSAATGAFNPDGSDIDFLVTFQETFEPGPWGKAIQDLTAELRALFDHNVDLIENIQFRNPWFQRAVDETRITVCRT